MRRGIAFNYYFAREWVLYSVEYDSIVKNAEYFKSILGESKLCAVVKNDAYGHGLVRTACALAGVADFFAVGNVAEAQKINLFAKEILILLPVPHSDVERAVEGNFVLTVDSFETLDSVIANTPRGRKARVHIKIESGMNRLGFEFSQLPLLVERLAETSKVTAEGAFSHFYGDTVSQCDAQFETFLRARDYLSAKLKRPLLSHIANSSAALLKNKYHLDMARVGLGLYGYGSEYLVPAKTVTAQVIAVRRVKACEVVGYGGAYKVQSDTNLAVINVGYAQGFSRALAGAKVKIGNGVFPIVGNVCMAMCMADVGGADVRVGDTVVVQGDGINNANEKVIVYELLCNLK